MNKCTNCKTQERRPSGRLCRDCHNEYMRQWRKGRHPKQERTTKRRVRELHRKWIQRGKITKDDHCEVCGKHGTEMHHEEYNRSVASIRWLCRSCHNAIHRKDLTLLTKEQTANA